jgi:hypothetical protein
MRVGLLWFDDDPREQLEDKVIHAVLHYRHKYGHSPNLCFVYPSAFGDGKGQVREADGAEIRPGRSVLRDHFWLGVAEESQGENTRPAPLEQGAEHGDKIEEGERSTPSRHRPADNRHDHSVVGGVR